MRQTAPLACRLLHWKNAEFYSVFYSDGQWYIYLDNKVVGKGETPSNFAINPDTDYALWVMHLSDGMVFFFNGVPVALMKASPYSNGKVGVVGVSSSDSASVPALVVADNFIVREP